MFEKKLKAYGLWNFARSLTRVSELFLGLPSCSWVGESDDELCSMLIEDILTGGNFGQKDRDRYRQIKYISNRNNKTVDKKCVIFQALHTIKMKAKEEKKNAVLVLIDYLRLVAEGKRKIDTGKTLREAEKRKNIYSSFRLFEAEDQ